MSLVRSLSLSCPAGGELDALESLFQSADVNHDGVVDFNEFRSVMEMLGNTTGKK